jgi:pimeloyl-ACP methyl ester carboxylesterase
MPGWREERFDVNGIDTAVFTAGEGPPLVYFHGGGTALGFDGLLPLAERFRLILPNHPGYGASADDPSIDDVHDYVRHYLDLFDLLGLDEFALAGHSMGGYLAAVFSVYQAERVRRLALLSPIGLRVREHPTIDIFSVPDEELLSYVTADMSILEGRFPSPPTPEFLADRYREATSTARVFWARVYDVKLPKWLHRLTMPTLLLWGEVDRLVPSEQAPVWAEYIPGAEVKIFPGVGHAIVEESREAVDLIGDFVGAELTV